MARPFEAFLLKDSPRYADWIKVFGVNRVQIRGALPQLANVCDQPDTEIYLLDLNALTSEQRERLVSHLSQKFNLARRKVERDLKEKGMPILAEDVGVPIDLRYFV